MKLESAHIKNFKLLKDVDLHFSVDPSKPLTVIRAENGSGKTSILYALQWALYGGLIIPHDMRLTSRLLPDGTRTVVQVRVEFTTMDPFSDEEIKYRLIRSCEETAGPNRLFSRVNDQVKLYQRTPDGERKIEEGREALINKILPDNLSDIFFTNGDDIQRFISSGQSQRTGQSQRKRQEAVHQAIRQILGHNDVEQVERNLRNISRKWKRELAKSGGIELQEANNELENIQDIIFAKKEELKKVGGRISRIEEHIQDDEHEIAGIQGIGDLDSIQANIKELNNDIKHLMDQEQSIRNQVRDLLQSEQVSWFFLNKLLNRGLDILRDLADRKIIPGTAIEVLIDRLEMGVCICGELLKRDTEHYKHVEDLVKEQQQKSQDQQQLTELLHRARDNERRYKSIVNDGKHFKVFSRDLQTSYSQCVDLRRRKVADLKIQEEKRGQINSSLLQLLTERIKSNRVKHSDFVRKYGIREGEIYGLEEQEKLAINRVKEAEGRIILDTNNRIRAGVVDDIFFLASGTLKKLKSEYVSRVAKRMNDIFLEIVGAEPEAFSAVFTGVTISDSFDIIIHTQGGNTLDPDHELNGASQRALTLSFIWALMEVAGRQAPRIIDAPLGMTSGSVKDRMVDLLTRPVEKEGLPYQIVLLMTRSEIRDIEDRIDERAGYVMTLSCSKDYPRDLVNNWGSDDPIVRVCSCNHHQVCDVCIRKGDDQRRMSFRQEVK